MFGLNLLLATWLVMADFPDHLLLICTQNVMAVEDDWNCEDEIDKLLSQVPLSKDSIE